jgi:hypothetical protein
MSWRAIVGVALALVAVLGLLSRLYVFLVTRD